MNLGSSAKVATTFLATATPAGTGVTNPARLGFGELTRKYTTATVLGIFKVVSAATSNVATLTLSTGAVAATTGSPVITDGDGKDFEGIAFPTIAKCQAIRIITPSTNTGTVTIGGSSSNRLPAIELHADSEITLKLPAAGLTISAQTLTATFSAAAQEVTVEFLGIGA